MDTYNFVLGRNTNDIKKDLYIMNGLFNFSKSNKGCNLLSTNTKSGLLSMMIMLLKK